jgi:hypothetical protein
MVLLVSIGSGAQAANVSLYQDPAPFAPGSPPAFIVGDEAAWTAAALLSGTGIIETPSLPNAPAGTVSIDVVPSIWSITFGNSLGGDNQAVNPALQGSISVGVYTDRADDNPNVATIHPVFTFEGLGIMAFGAQFNLGPNFPGTGIGWLIEFVNGDTLDLADAILNQGPLVANGFYEGFFGIVSDMAIRSITFNEAGAQQFAQLFETFSMTDPQFVSAVPIPAALPLFLSAIAALGFFGRRKIRAAAA